MDNTDEINHFNTLLELFTQEQALAIADYIEFRIEQDFKCRRINDIHARFEKDMREANNG